VRSLIFKFVGIDEAGAVVSPVVGEEKYIGKSVNQK
jgi:hypothetical protein